MPLILLLSEENSNLQLLWRGVMRFDKCVTSSKVTIIQRSAHRLIATAPFLPHDRSLNKCTTQVTLHTLLHIYCKTRHDLPIGHKPSAAARTTHTLAWRRGFPLYIWLCHFLEKVNALTSRTTFSYSYLGRSKSYLVQKVKKKHVICVPLGGAREADLTI